MLSFSVIVPTYNRAALIGPTLDSIFAQQHMEFEVIVIDDGSTDQTDAILNQYRGKITILKQECGGPGAARNLGARHASGEYLAFLDSDDLWFPWTLRVYAEVIQSEAKPAFIAGRPAPFREEPALQLVTREKPEWLRFSDYFSSSSEWRWWGASSFVVRRDIFEMVGGFTSKWVNGEDADLAMRLGVAPGFVQVLAPATFGYREHAASAMSQFEKTVAGIQLKIHAEQAGAYPGGEARAGERLEILSRHARPVMFGCLRSGRQKEGWRLYVETLRWHVRLGRWKAILAFPCESLFRFLSKCCR